MSATVSTIRQPLIEGGKTYHQITEDICTPTERTPRNDIDLPNTGGEWIFFTPGISYWLLDKLSLNANIDLPIYSFIEGLQVTPTYRLNIGIYYQINFNPKDSHFPF